MSAVAKVKQDYQKLDYFQELLKSKKYSTMVRPEDYLEVQMVIHLTKNCLEGLQKQLAMYKLPEPSIWNEKEVRVLSSASINPGMMTLYLCKTVEIKFQADGVFKQFQDAMTKYLILPSLAEYRLESFDFSEVMLKFAEFDKSYSECVNSIEEQIKACNKCLA